MFIKGFMGLALVFAYSFSQDVADSLSADSAVTPPPAPAFSVDLARGQSLFRKTCEICHGEKGDGRGPAARFLEPRPRDFTLGIYKLRTTATGNLPTDQDLLRTLSRGIPGTAMIGFSGFTAEERWQIVQYVKSLSKRFSENPPPTPLVWAARLPEVTADRLARGKEIYDGLECAKCHGEDGRGNGPTAYTLKDSQGRPIFPFDMTRGRKMKSGPAVDDIFRVLMTGLGGTPMPSYQESLPEEEAWLLSLYVKSLFVDE